jgi:hypothetical protein
MEDSVKPDLRPDGEHQLPTEQYKYAIMLDFAKRFNLTTYVETGTCEGYSLKAVSPYFKESYSIELSPEYYQKAVDHFKDNKAVHLIRGDSAVELKKLLATILDASILFYLDAHFSGGQTVGSGSSPLRKELTAIFDSGVNGIIVIDDCIDYRHDGVLEEAIQVVSEFSEWDQNVKHGLMRVWRKA